MFLKMYSHARRNVLQYLLCIANVLNNWKVIHLYILVYIGIYFEQVFGSTSGITLIIRTTLIKLQLSNPTSISLGYNKNDTRKVTK